MSETGEVRRGDVRRDDMMGEGPAETTMGDVRRDDGLGDGGRDSDLGGSLGEDRRDSALGDVRGEATTGDVRNMGQNEQGDQTPLSTDQIANPGAAQPAATSAAGAPSDDSDAAQLLDPKDRDAMTQRWRDIQADFVDQPRKAMQDADALVAGLMQQLAQMFSQERSQLEAQWSRGDQVSTEDLRVSLQRYRAFFERLLSV
jgi:hypothetical protein